MARRPPREGDGRKQVLRDEQWQHAACGSVQGRRKKYDGGGGERNNRNGIWKAIGKHYFINFWSQMVQRHSVTIDTALSYLSDGR